MKYCLVLLTFTSIACQTFGQHNNPVETAIAGTVAVQQGVSQTLTASASGLTPVAIYPSANTETNTPSPHEINLTIGEQSLHVGERHSWQVSLHNAESILLSIETRVDWPNTAGLAYLMELLVNNSPITGDFLVNKAINFTFADGRIYSYFDYLAGYTSDFTPYWGVFYSPDYQANHIQQGKTPQSNNIYAVMEGNAYSYVFDVTSLLKGTEVEIVLTNKGGAYEEFLGTPIILYYQQLTLLVSE